ncbi:MAG: type II secretion system F family protein [Natronospirillum sp.]
MLNSVVVIYALVFAAALLLLEAFFRTLLGSRRRSQDVSNRLENIKLTKEGEEAHHELLARRGFRADNTRRSWLGTMGKYYSQSGIETNFPRLFLYGIMIFLIGFVGSDLFLANLVLQAILGVALAVIVICGYIVIARRRRIKKFTAQLAPAIDVIVRSLNAGHPVTAAISMVAREMPDPVGSEFGILTDQITFGSDLETAMHNLAERVGAPEIDLLTVTISVQQGTGGNLSEILENLAQMLRDRLMLRAKIMAISAEGRITAWIMLLFPFFLFAMIISLVPDYFDLVWESGWGETIVVVCIGFMLFGFLIVRKLVNFDF